MSISLVTDSLRAPEPPDPWSIKVRRRGYQQMLLVRSQINFYYFWEKRWFFVAVALGFVMMAMPQPEGLTREGQIVLTMSAIAIICRIGSRAVSSVPIVELARRRTRSR